ncbi:MAG: dihydrofolate reductase family protein [Tagaea sp.]|nr:dihydrofolate reductase family protein [Tagaea sp.]
MRVWIAVSADGFIADSAGGVDWLAPFDSREFGFDAFVEGIGALIHGRTTYGQVLGFGEWPYGARRTFVLTRGTPPESPHLGGFDAEPARLLARAREAAGGKDIWLDGGAGAIAAFLDAGLIDSFEAVVLPVVLGGGLPLFACGKPRALRAIRGENLAGGAARLTYDLAG